MERLTKEQFIDLIDRYHKNNEFLDKVEELFPYFYELDVVDFGYYMFDRVIEAYFLEEGVEWVFWWLFDKDGDPEMKAFDKDEKEIPTETVDDLWNIVKEYLK